MYTCRSFSLLSPRPVSSPTWCTCPRLRMSRDVQRLDRDKKQQQQRQLSPAIGYWLTNCVIPSCRKLRP